MPMYYSCYQDVVAQGASHLDMFIRDYYDFIFNLGYPISLNAFAEEWRCIPAGVFQRLQPGDRIYMKTSRSEFSELIIMFHPTYSKEEEMAVVEGRFADNPDDSGDANVYIFNDGDAYATNRATEHTPEEYRLLHPEQFPKGGNNSWPTKVITTKTKAQ